jgi:hypothetical protein
MKHMHFICIVENPIVKVNYLCAYITKHYAIKDRLCGLVVRVPGYRSRRPSSIPGRTRIGYN